MSLRTLVYLRRSTQDREDRQAVSIERQERDIMEALEKWEQIARSPAEKLLCNPEKDFLREDASAKRPGRPVFQDLVDRIKRGKCDVLLCTELTRLSRNAQDNGTLIQLLDDGLLKEVRTINQVYRSSNPTEVFTLSLFLGVAKYENDQRGLNTASGIRNRKKSGATTHKAPLGYINVGEIKGRRAVEADPESFGLLQDLWKLFLSDTCSLSEIFETALAWDITYPSKNGRKIPSASTIRNMFKNRYYTGKVLVKNKNGVEEWIEGNHFHLAMISEEDFDKVQLLLQKRGHTHSTIESLPDLSDLIKLIGKSGLHTTQQKNDLVRPASIVFEEKTRYTCSSCKHRFSSIKPKDCPRCNAPYGTTFRIEEHRYYSHLSNGKKLDAFPAQKAEDTLRTAIGQLHLTPELFSVMERQLYTIYLEKEKTYAKKYNALSKKLQDLWNEETSITRRMASGETTQSQGEKALETINSDQEAVKDSQEKLREEFLAEFDIAWTRLQLIRDSKELLNPSVDFEPKKRLILSLVSNLVFYKDHVEVEWQKPFGKLVKSPIAKIAGSAGPTECLGASSIGSPGWIRTNDQAINSRLLYH